ncbi:MAG: type II toxin-antitoxin system MqsA family antitoxin [Lachnospiraceae bacterium]|nr:type II toxin-antitoxin system MqsA family antitoxin [Lachnospiraceae bacterium]
MNKFVTTEYIYAEDIKKIRKKLKLTQKDFALLVNSSKPTIERWERSDTAITGPIVALIKMLERYPEYVEKIKIPKKEYPVRLYYMHNDKICTLIDVDEHNRQVSIKNYVDHLMFRAFGIVENPKYEDYLEFLESRCFPRTRDKMKLVLEELNLPFYEPFMIIEKTEGRMAEDDFWIKIER